MRSEDAIKNSGHPGIGVICSNCKDECKDEHGVYAYAGQLTPRAFCSKCKEAAIDFALLSKRDFIKAYSRFGSSFSISNWSRKRSGGRTKRFKGKSKKVVMSPLDKLLMAGVVVEEV